MAKQWKEQQALQQKKQQTGVVYNAYKDFVKD
jgi:hypothetical protein